MECGGKHIIYILEKGANELIRIDIDRKQDYESETLATQLFKDADGKRVVVTTNGWETFFYDPDRSRYFFRFIETRGNLLYRMPLKDDETQERLIFGRNLGLSIDITAAKAQEEVCIFTGP